MITTFLLSLLNAFLGFLLGLLPVGSLPIQFTEAVNYFVGILYSFSYIFPVTTLVAALLVYLVFDGVVLLWHLLQWVIRKIPGMQ